jgi:DNA primase
VISWADAIKEHYDIVEFADEFLQLQRKGKNYFALCPFHEDRNPSMSISPQRQRYKCFSCGVSGTVIDLYAKANGLNDLKAIRQLGQRMGLNKKQPLTVSQMQEIQQKRLTKEQKKRQKMKIKKAFQELAELGSIYKERAKQYNNMEQLEADEKLVSFYQHIHIYEEVFDQILAASSGELNDNEIERALNVAKGVLMIWHIPAKN